MDVDELLSRIYAQAAARAIRVTDHAREEIDEYDLMPHTVKFTTHW